MVGPYEDSTPEYRERETATMRAAILGATQLPNDPSAARSPDPGSHANFPTIRLRLAPPIWGTAKTSTPADAHPRPFPGRDLESLLKKDRKHPAYRKTLTILLPEMRRAGGANERSGVEFEYGRHGPPSRTCRPSEWWSRMRNRRPSIASARLRPCAPLSWEPSNFPTIRLRLAPPIWGTAIYTAGPIPETSKAFSKGIASIQRIAKP